MGASMLNEAIKGKKSVVKDAAHVKEDQDKHML